MIGELRTRHIAHNCCGHCSAGVTTTLAWASPGWSSGQLVLLGPTIAPGPASTAGNEFSPQTPPALPLGPLLEMLWVEGKKALR
ncbi:unnamed protein product [Prunus armeniaca]